MNASSIDSSKTQIPDIKQINRSNIYALLRSGESYTRQGIVVTLGLSLPTVVQNLNEMMLEGLVQETGLQHKTGGRRAMTYSAVKDFRIAIGLDITLHHASAVALDLSGDILGHIRIKLDFSRTAQYYERLGSLVSELIHSTNIDTERILGVGISIPCLINNDGTHSYYCRVLDTDELTCEEFASFIPYPVRLCHDTISSAFAESWCNPVKDDFFYLMLSHSIGGAVFINGSVYNGSNYRSCEIGHVQLVQNGRMCYCGKRGCADAYCSAKPLVAQNGGDLPLFFDMLATDDEDSVNLWQEYLQHLAQAIHNIHMLYDCKIVLGGRIGERMEGYIDPLRAKLMSMDPFIDDADYISVCNAKLESSASGAALHFIKDYIASI